MNRGEVWLVCLNPTVGDEMKKERYCVIVSADYLSRLRLRVIVPITSWKERFENSLCHVRLDPSSSNGLTMVSAADSFQIRAVSEDRFLKKMGVVSADELADIVSAIALVVGF